MSSPCWFSLEALFRVLPVSTATRSAYHIDPLILTYPAHHCFTAATGWDLKNVQRNCTNNFGFLADRDFVHDPQAVALIGDSFIEANMLPASERLAAQLEARLAGAPIYAMGGPGSNLLDYAQRAKFAAAKFGTRTFIFVVERGDVKQSICGSGNVHGWCIDARTLRPKTAVQAPPSALKRLARESALAQYVFSQLRFDISKTFAKLKNPAVQRPNAEARDLSLEATAPILNQFLEQLSTIQGGRFLLLIDADRVRLSATRSSEGNDLKSLKEAVTAMNATVIDPTVAFREYVAHTGRVLEVGPYDRHWNGDAVRIVADLIAEQLPVSAARNP